MPIHEYQCQKCLDTQETINNPNAPICHKCGQIMTKIISGCAVTPRKWRADKPKHGKRGI